MGLDMSLYAYIADNVKPENIGSWRKHANLHGHMEHLYRERGGDALSFNCIPLELTKEDCEEIIKLSQGNELKTAEGFFWGKSYPEHDKETIEYMTKAIKAIEEGKQVFYDSWW